MNHMTDRELRQLALQMRKRVLEIGYGCGISGVHFGGTLSLIEIMIALYKNILPQDCEDKGESKVIMSKGHGILAQYLLMENTGVMDRELVDAFKQDFAICAAHPSRDLVHNIEFSSGSLGQGLSLGLGIVLARKRSSDLGRVYVILGDGECDEGSVWEAAAAAAHYHACNLVAIVDKNDIQYDGLTSDVLDMGDLSEKFRAFGWETLIIDGHDIGAVTEALQVRCRQPLAIIAHTVKGKGISFMEGKPEWHHKALTETLFKEAMQELQEAEVTI